MHIDLPHLAQDMQSTSEYIVPYTRKNYNGTQESRATLWHLAWKPPLVITHDTISMLDHIPDVAPNVERIPYYGYTIADIPWNIESPDVLTPLQQIQHDISIVQDFLAVCQLFTTQIPPEHTSKTYNICIPTAKHILNTDPHHPTYYQYAIKPSNQFAPRFMLYVPNEGIPLIPLTITHIPACFVDAINRLHTYKYIPSDNQLNQNENFFVSPITHINTLSRHALLHRLRRWAHYFPDVAPPNIA